VAIQEYCLKIIHYYRIKIPIIESLDIELLYYIKDINLHIDRSMITMRKKGTSKMIKTLLESWNNRGLTVWWQSCWFWLPLKSWQKLYYTVICYYKILLRNNYLQSSSFVEFQSKIEEEIIESVLANSTY